jgi:hypothetical protein
VVSTCTIMQEVLWVKTWWIYCGFTCIIMHCESIH